MLEARAKCNGHIEITPAHSAPEFGGKIPDFPLIGQADLVCSLHTFGYKFGQEVHGDIKESIDTQLPIIGNELATQYCGSTKSS